MNYFSVEIFNGRKWVEVKQLEDEQEACEFAYRHQAPARVIDLRFAVIVKEFSRDLIVAR